MKAQTLGRAVLEDSRIEGIKMDQSCKNDKRKGLYSVQ